MLSRSPAGTDKNYPFIIKASNIQNREVDFDLERIQKIYNKQDKRGLNQYCKDLNIFKYDFTTVDDSIKKQNEFWEYVHHVLNETIVNEGILICPNCGREYPIKNGIINMVLQDDEMWMKWNFNYITIKIIFNLIINIYLFYNNF